jgi:hypothetical protein
MSNAAAEPSALYGAGLRAAAQHSQALYPVFTHIPGLKVVIPATPYDAKGLLLAAIRDDDPVMFFEHKALYDMTGPVPEESYTLPFGEAALVREGSDVTIVTLGRMVHTSLAAADELAGSRVSCEVVDLRTTSPLDEDTILESVENTGRLEPLPGGWLVTLASSVTGASAPPCAATSAELDLRDPRSRYWPSARHQGSGATGSARGTRNCS